MRRNNVFWAIVLLGAGSILLLNNLGLIKGNVWIYLWSAFLVFLGLWMIFSPVIFRHNMETRSLALPLDGAPAAKVVFKHAVGTLQVHSLSTPGQLLSGTFGGGVEEDVERKSNDHTKVTLKIPGDVWMAGPWGGKSERLAWDVALTGEIPLTLKFETGVSRSTLDLHDLKVVDLKIETGASETELYMPASAGFTDAKISCGAANVVIHIPLGVAARIHSDAGLATVNIDPRFVKTEAGWESPDYTTAANKVDLKLETGVGKIEVIS